MLNGYCMEVDNVKRKHRCKMCEILERENAETKFAKSGNCECNCHYTHLSSFRHSCLVDHYAKQARETLGFSMRLA